MPPQILFLSIITKKTKMADTPKVPDEVIMQKIYQIRDQKVMLDRDLADLYEVETKQLKRQVRRNPERFPEDFMFELSKEEFDDLKDELNPSQWGGTRYPPMAFTEQGVSMLSSVLNSDKAIAVNIQIIRIFTRMRKMLSTHKEIFDKLKDLEEQVTNHDENIELIFKYLKELLNPENARRQIGFKREQDDE